MGLTLSRGVVGGDGAQLADSADFVDAAFLLLSGALPDQNKHAEFEAQLKFHNLVHEKLIRFYEGFKSDAHPMAIMVRVCGRQCTADEAGRGPCMRRVLVAP